MKKELVKIDKLKNFAKFILENYLDEFVKLDLSRANKVDLPLLKLFSKLSEAEMIGYFTKSAQDLMSEIIEDRAIEASEAFIKNLKSNQIEYLKRDKVLLADVALSYNVRKHSFLSLLPSYTSDSDELVTIMREIEDFYTFRQGLAFEAYTEINTEILRNSEENFKSLAEASFEGIIIHNNPIILEVNQVMADILGYSREELIGKSILQITPKEEHQKLLRNAQSNLEEAYETTGLRKDGSTFPAEIVGRAITFKGENVRVAGVRDITDRKKQEEEKLKNYQQVLVLNEQLKAMAETLSEKTQTFQNILDSIPVFVFWKDDKNKLLGFNKAYQQAMNIPAEVLLTKSGYELFPDADKYHKDDLMVIKTGQPKLNIVESIETPDGFFYAKTDKVPLRNIKGDIIGVIGTSMDITELKTIQEELHVLNADLEKRVEERTKELLESERSFRILTDFMPQMVWISSPEGAVVYANEKLLKFADIPKDDFKGDEWIKSIHEEDVEKVEKAWKQAIDQKSMFEAVYRFRRASDRMYRWHIGRALPLQDEAGNILRWFGTATDIHDERATQEELKRINNDLDNFIYTASHDLKAPVSNIEGLTNTLHEIIKEKYTDDQDLENVLEMISFSIKKFQATIKDLTEVSKSQKNIYEDIEVLDVCEIIEDVKTNISNIINETKAVIKINTHNCPALKYSKANFRSILHNLITNSIKYKKPDVAPIIEITTEKQKEYFLLRVKDNGLGIRPEHRNKIFQMFKRLHDHVEGTGIGLYIVKRILDNTGGKIEVDSEVDKGSTFKIFFKQ